MEEKTAGKFIELNVIHFWNEFMNWLYIPSYADFFPDKSRFMVIYHYNPSTIDRTFIDIHEHQIIINKTYIQFPQFQLIQTHLPTIIT